MSNSDLGDDLAKLYPVVERDMSDSGSLDNVLEFLIMVGNRFVKTFVFRGQYSEDLNTRLVWYSMAQMVSKSE